jgi:hypothetical protein
MGPSDKAETPLGRLDAALELPGLFVELQPDAA